MDEELASLFGDLVPTIPSNIGTLHYDYFQAGCIVRLNCLLPIHPLMDDLDIAENCTFCVPCISRPTHESLLHSSSVHL